MKRTTGKVVEYFNPIVLKKMLLFSLGSINSMDEVVFHEDNFGYENDDSVYDFLIEIFLNEVKKIMLVKPYKEYITKNEDLSFAKGKINVKEFYPILMNKINCSYGELSLDSKLNQMIKYILYYLLQNVDIRNDARLYKKIISVYTLFNDVSFVDIRINDINNMSLHNGNKQYMHILLYAKYMLNSIVENKYTNQKYIDLDHYLWWIYQEFIRNYYSYHAQLLNIKKVYSSNCEWNFEPILDSDSKYLPNMRTDIEIETKDAHIIIDAKCYQNFMDSYYGKEMFVSSNLYQMKAYLDADKSNKHFLRGILVYPKNYDLLEDFKPQFYLEKNKHRTLEIYVIDFQKEWQEICKELDRIICNEDIQKIVKEQEV